MDTKSRKTIPMGEKSRDFVSFQPRRRFWFPDRIKPSLLDQIVMLRLLDAARNVQAERKGQNEWRENYRP